MTTMARMWCGTWRVGLLAMCVVALAPPEAQALAEGQGVESTVSLRTVPNALLTVDQNRSTVVERIVGEWGEALAGANAGISAEQLRATLLAMRADYLLAASMAGSLEGLRKVVESSVAGSLTGAGGGGAITPKALGDTTADLVYTPVVPCRIVDTRNAGGGGTFGSPETRSYHAYLTSGTFVTQGGAASNCGVPANPAAVALNITVVSSTANFYLTAWPYNQAKPVASTLNYVPGQIVANGAIIPICQPSCAADFSVFAAAVDLIVDVLGYFAAPVATALQCTPVASAATPIAVSSDTLVALPACAAGYTRTGSSCAGTSGVPGGYLLETNASGCLFRNLSSVTTYNGTATAICCRIPGR